MPFCNISLKGKKPVNPSYPAELNTIGDHIRKVRLDRGLLQKDVAKIIGVAEESITNWENDKRSPVSGKFKSITSFLGYTPSCLRQKEILGEKLKDYRKKNYLTQKELAKRIGISLNTYAGIENNIDGKIMDSTRNKISNFISA